jgi:oligopeptidase B
MPLKRDREESVPDSASTILKQPVAAPVARREAKIVLIGNVPDSDLARGNDPAKLISPPMSVVDDLYWLRDDERKNAEVISHLEAENAYCNYCTSHFSEQQQKMYDELKSRLKESDQDVPYKKGGFMYYLRTEEGKAYPIHCRMPLHDDIQGSRPEQIICDENDVAQGQDQCDVKLVDVSENHSLVAFSVDFSGSEVYDIHIKHLSDSAYAEDILKGSDGSFVWDARSVCLYYTTLDDQRRPHRLWRHVVGTPQGQDLCILHESDHKSWMRLQKSTSGDFVFVRCASKMTSEVYVIPLNERACAALFGANSTLQPAPALLSFSQLEAEQQSQQETQSAVLPHVEKFANSQHLLPASPLHLVQAKVDGMLYELDHHRCADASGASDGFVIITNRNGAKNFELCYCKCSQTSQENWSVLIRTSPSIYITEVDVHSHFWALSCREHGYECVMLALPSDIAAAVATIGSQKVGSELKLHRLPPRDEVFVMSYGRNAEYETSAFRFTYTSPTTPHMTCEYCVEDSPCWSKNIKILKQKEVPNVDTAAYRTARLMAPSVGGISVPISILFRPSAHGITCGSDCGFSECPFKQPAPLLLYGYGAYGISWDPEFSAAALSLCDRGVVYAIAHVRGGGEMGRSWYEDEGRLLTKKNSFDDFIAAAEHLIRLRWTCAGSIVAEGGSAGGLIMGVVANLKPQLWAGILMQYPFVDAVITMADPSIPLVNTEWDEWGNPNEQDAYEYIRSYSPMDNIRPQAYPRMLLEAGLTDYRVGYWEPAKFIQRIRAANTGSSEILLKCEMDQGHTGPTDRYKHIHEKAFEICWVLDCLGLGTSTRL